LGVKERIGMSQRASSMPVHPSRQVARIVRAIRVVEDAIHVVVAVLLTALGVALIVYTLRQIAVVFTGPHDLGAIVLAVLNETLLLFIVAELLHTVAIAIKHGGALDPMPFLVVGLVAGIRRVLILTAEAEQAFHWDPQGIELLILMALILVMALTTLVWRRSTRHRDRGAPNRTRASTRQQVQGPTRVKDSKTQQPLRW
jgi:phosphate starvation-inducible membrane PsiE